MSKFTEFIYKAGEWLKRPSTRMIGTSVLAVGTAAATIIGEFCAINREQQEDAARKEMMDAKMNEWMERNMPAAGLKTVSDTIYDNVEEETAYSLTDGSEEENGD